MKDEKSLLVPISAFSYDIPYATNMQRRRDIVQLQKQKGYKLIKVVLYVS